MKPPTMATSQSTVKSHLQNGVSSTQSISNMREENDDGERSDNWDAQRNRIDGLLSTLKKEMQEVKSMDKNLTRQFIHLGGKIQELKKVEEKLFEEILQEEENNELITENNNETSVTVLEDTRL